MAGRSLRAELPPHRHLRARRRHPGGRALGPPRQPRPVARGHQAAPSRWGPPCAVAWGRSASAATCRWVAPCHLAAVTLACRAAAFWFGHPVWGARALLAAHRQHRAMLGGERPAPGGAEAPNPRWSMAPTPPGLGGDGFSQRAAPAPEAPGPPAPGCCADRDADEVERPGRHGIARRGSPRVEVERPRGSGAGDGRPGPTASTLRRRGGEHPADRMDTPWRTDQVVGQGRDPPSINPGTAGEWPGSRRPRSRDRSPRRR